MSHYLIRVELHHDEHTSDYSTLHHDLYNLNCYRVSKIGGLTGWYDLPTAGYLLKYTNLSVLQTYNLVKNVVTEIISSHLSYWGQDLKQYYSIMVTQVFEDANRQLIMQVNLQKTTDVNKLPPGEVL
jgi:hypothetical protein